MVDGRRDVEYVRGAFARVVSPRVLLAHRQESCLDVWVIPSPSATGKTNGENGETESSRKTDCQTCDLARPQPLKGPRIGFFGSWTWECRCGRICRSR